MKHARVWIRRRARAKPCHGPTPAPTLSLREGVFRPRRGCHLLEVVEQSLHLRREMATAWIDGMYRRGRRVPIGKNTLKASGAEVVNAAVLGQHCDANATHDRIVGRETERTG